MHVKLGCYGLGSAKHGDMGETNPQKNICEHKMKGRIIGRGIYVEREEIKVGIVDCNKFENVR